MSDAYCYLRSARLEHLHSAADQAALRSIVDDYVSKFHLMCSPAWAPVTGMMCMLSDLLGLSEEDKGSMMILKSMHNCVARVKDFMDIVSRQGVHLDQELWNSSVRACDTCRFFICFELWVLSCSLVVDVSWVPDVFEEPWFDFELFSISISVKGRTVFCRSSGG